MKLRFPLLRKVLPAALGFAILPQISSGQSIPNDPDFPMQWALQNSGQVIAEVEGIPGADIQALEAWNHAVRTSPVVVALIGTGVDVHAEFADRLLQGFVTSAAGGDPYSTLDTAGYGTHYAGIIAAKRNNDFGIAGINDSAVILPVRAFNGAVGGDASVAEGILWAVDHGADIILVPVQFYDNSEALENAIAHAESQGVLLVAPAGHTGSNEVAFPCRYPSVLCVAASDSMDAPALFSNYGDEVDLAAPSVNIWSTRMGGGFGFEPQATSGLAAAHVAGAASLMLAVSPQLTAPEIRSILVASADEIGKPGWDVHCGAGRLDLRRSLELTPEPAIRFEWDDPPPEVIPPHVETGFHVNILDDAGTLNPQTPLLHFRFSTAGLEIQRSLQRTGANGFVAELPAAPCGTAIEYFLSARSTDGEEIRYPRRAPNQWSVARVDRIGRSFTDTFEEDLRWTTEVEGDDTRGAWTRVAPVATTAQPGFDTTPDEGRLCFVTGQHAGGSPGTSDVDGGPVRLLSPTISVDVESAEVEFACWFASQGGTPDVLAVEGSMDGGEDWGLLDSIAATNGWEKRRLVLGDYSGLRGDRLQLRFSTSDVPSDSLTEAAIDDVRVIERFCTAVPGDADGDGNVDPDDFSIFVNCLLGPSSPFPDSDCLILDLDRDDDIDLMDGRILINDMRAPKE